ncbi:MAG: hypothetical protein R3A48_25330 [Polyangiales bacterium]
MISAAGCKCGRDPCDLDDRHGGRRGAWHHHDDDDEVCPADAGSSDAPAGGDAGVAQTNAPGAGGSDTGGGAGSPGASDADAGAHPDVCNNPPPPSI